MRHEEQMISVFVDLCPMDLSGAVLDRQRMKPESLLHETEVGFVGRLKVDPAHFTVARRDCTVRPVENFEGRAIESDCAEHLGSSLLCWSGRRAYVEHDQMNTR
jgi:hypothetical protein